MTISKEEMAKQIAMVRCTGRTNMFDRNGVGQILVDMGYVDTAIYLTENKPQEFVEILKMSGKITEEDLEEYDYKIYENYVLM